MESPPSLQIEPRKKKHLCHLIQSLATFKVTPPLWERRRESREKIKGCKKKEDVVTSSTVTSLVQVLMSFSQQ